MIVIKVAPRVCRSTCCLQEPPHEGSVPAPAHEPAEDDEAPSDEEVAAILATDPTDRAPGQEVGPLDDFSRISQ